ncbi:methyl-accepting chemotaxis protein [Brevibacillus ginsengisoli]|uniref:methyl-accepting chemotaxis protein n=1 Tax=Brevibacillus ginsengisoli TaxID=363854 RepID=UPI003CE8C030
MKKLSHKVILLMLSACLLLGVLINGMAYLYMSSAKERAIAQLDDSLRKGFDRKIQSEVESVISLLHYYDNRAKKGEMTKEAAMKQAADAVRELRYSGDSYFWIDTYDGTNVVFLGKKESEGKNRYNQVDAKGNHFIQEIIENGKKGGGFSDYYFPRNGGTEPLPKRSYSIAFEDFGWVVGTGNYTDDIDQAVRLDTEELELKFKHNLLTLFTLSFSVIVVIIVCAVLFSLRLTKPLEYTTAYLARLAKGDFRSEMESKDSRLQDEIGVLIRSSSNMRDSIRQIITGITQESEEVNRLLHQTMEHMGHLNGQIEDISATTEEMSAGMQQTAASTEEMNASASGIRRAVENISARLVAAEASTQEINQRAKELKDSALHSQAVAQEMYLQTNQKLKDAIQKSSAVQQIGQLSTAIMNIAAQTNLLSLNASIEAARAGEAGKGFSVVALEIRKLAEHSRDSATEIQEVVNSVMEAVQHLSDSSSEVMGFIDQQVIQDYQLQIVTAEKYNEDAHMISRMMADFSETTHQLLTSIELMTNSLNEISIATSQGAIGTTDIAEKSGIIVSDSDTIVNLCEEVTQCSKRLLESVAQFKI